MSPVYAEVSDHNSAARCSPEVFFCSRWPHDDSDGTTSVPQPCPDKLSNTRGKGEGQITNFGILQFPKSHPS